MALKATIYKAQVNVADMDRDCYLDGSFTLACHPSETLQRLMLRVLAWGLNADPELTFTKGLCETDEPDLWKKNLNDEIEIWVELGLPDEKRIRKAAQKSAQVVIYAYGDHAAPVWWQAMKSKAAQYKNVTVVFIDDEVMDSMADMVERTMQLQLTIEGEHAWLSSASSNCTIVPQWWQRSAS
ncbi:YaeQ family protein [Photobacterium sp. 1_MG-2023]|uniref:YaeQ family protein n=1 Tax=Photobacterium sp. 1_MG-2023 TaxID=3062646 RepID=UPI0026E14B67|nr:YaeQ family protein [Photobacterium sp. 1_MG-2023]MDO6706718.1 YaeQ family protein [Photobacterium sp. 1_MG-2023]